MKLYIPNKSIWYLDNIHFHPIKFLLVSIDIIFFHSMNNEIFIKPVFLNRINDKKVSYPAFIQRNEKSEPEIFLVELRLGQDPLQCPDYT